MKKLTHLFIVLFIGIYFITCTPENIAENTTENITDKVCCDDDGDIPPPPVKIVSSSN